MKFYSIITIIIVAIPFLFHACDSDSPCELTEDDKEWLLENYDSLFYLYNDSDTVVAKATTVYSQSEYQYQLGIRTGNNNYYGYSKIIFGITNSDSILFRYWIHACDQSIHIDEVFLDNGKIKHAKDYFILKDSISNIDKSIYEKDYTNIISISNIQDSIFKEFSIVKEFGIIEFQTYQNEKFELLPLNFEK